MLSIAGGTRQTSVNQLGIETRIVGMSVDRIRAHLSSFGPDVIHAHVPGYPHPGDILGAALSSIPKIPVVQTNIFGRLQNPAEEHWTDYRLFISWTSCVQAARRASLPLDADFFRRASVAVYPLDADNGPSAEELASFRRSIGVSVNDVLLARFSRPEPNKWLDLPVLAFRKALRRNVSIKFLLQEPPPRVAKLLERGADHDRFIILPMTANPAELHDSMAAADIILHTSSIGESFGYGIAEPMNFGKPVITNAVPWADQAQIELVRNGECGFVASTVSSVSRAIIRLARDTTVRQRMGRFAQTHIRQLADPKTSLDRLESALQAAVHRQENPNLAEDLATATSAAKYLDQHQYGENLLERVFLKAYERVGKLRYDLRQLMRPESAGSR